MFTDTLTLVLRLVVMALVAFAAFEDVRAMRIRNTISMAVALLFLPMIFILPFAVTVQHLVCGFVFFLIGAGMYYARMVGGGDAKLIGALALWPELHHIPAFLMVMTLSGGVLALVALGLKRSSFLPKLAEKSADNSWLAKMAAGETVVPYGVAIAIAAAVTLF